MLPEIPVNELDADMLVFGHKSGLQAFLLVALSIGPMPISYIVRTANLLSNAESKAHVFSLKPPAVIGALGSLSLDGLVRMAAYRSPKNGGRLFALTELGQQAVTMNNKNLSALALAYLNTPNAVRKEEKDGK